MGTGPHSQSAVLRVGLSTTTMRLERSEGVGREEVLRRDGEQNWLGPVQKRSSFAELPGETLGLCSLPSPAPCLPPPLMCHVLSHVRLCDASRHPVHGISQARILEWVAISYSRRSQLRD